MSTHTRVYRERERESESDPNRKIPTFLQRLAEEMLEPEEGDQDEVEAAGEGFRA